MASCRRLARIADHLEESVRGHVQLGIDQHFAAGGL